MTIKKTYHASVIYQAETDIDQYIVDYINRYFQHYGLAPRYTEDIPALTIEVIESIIAGNDTGIELNGVDPYHQTTSFDACIYDLITEYIDCYCDWEEIETEVYDETVDIKN